MGICTPYRYKFPLSARDPHTEYSQQTRDGKKIPYAYRTFAENYGKYAKKHKATMPIRRKPGKVLGAALSRLTTKDTYWR